MRIESRLRIATWITFGICTLMTASIAWTQLQVRRAQVARGLVTEIFVTQTDRELLRDDFIIRREPRAAAQLEETTAELTRLLDRADRELKSRSERVLVATIRSEFDGTKAFSEELERVVKASGGPEAIGLSYSESDTLFFGQYLMRSYAIHDGIAALRRLESDAVDEAVEMGTLIAVLVVILGTIVISINYFRLGRQFAGRALSIEGDLGLIGKGDLDHRLDASGDDEFSALAKAINDMAARLKESHASVEVLRGEIERRVAAEELGARTIEEKETLLRELFHRTRNNMQIIMALLDAEAALSPDPGVGAIVKRTNARIMSMALVHGLLYESDNLATIKLDAYCRDVAALPAQSGRDGGGKVVLVNDCEPVRASIETAVPFGLALHELVSNARRHAYPDGRAGEIRVTLRKSPSGTIELEVADDGVGLPEAIESRLEETLGLQLVHTLIEGQLRGRLWYENDAGLRWHASFEDGHGLQSPSI